MAVIVRALSRAGAGAVLIMSGAFLVYFLKHAWEGYRETARSWEPAKCRAASFEVKECSPTEHRCFHGYCAHVKVTYKQGGDKFSKEVPLTRENECSYTSKEKAEDGGEKFVTGGDEPRGDFECYAVPGDDQSVSEKDLTRSGSEKARDLSGKIFISIFILGSALVCLGAGVGSIIKAFNYIARPEAIRERPTLSLNGRVTEPGDAALGSLHIRKSIVEKLVAAMPTKEVTAEDGASGESAVECSICLDDNDEETRVVRLPDCDHHFHDRCIIGWLGRGHNACPVCRAVVLQKEKIREKARNRSARVQTETSETQPESEGQSSGLADAPNTEALRMSRVDGPVT